jgi:hypothetical protein
VKPVWNERDGQGFRLAPFSVSIGWLAAITGPARSLRPAPDDGVTLAVRSRKRAVHAVRPLDHHATASRLASRTLLSIALLALAACATQAPAPEVMPAPDAPAVAPVTTRGEFTIAANKLDTWNAIGQIVVNTSGASYEGRSQMLDLYTVRFHEQPFLLITRALLLSDTVKDTTTLVTARTLDGAPIDSDASAELLALLQQQLPAQIDKDRAKQAADAAAAKAAAKHKKASKSKSKSKSHKTK